jgi:AraC family transcriptional regulator
MSWHKEYARPITRPLVAPGIKFILWDYECDADEDRLATNDDHVISMMLTRQCDARARHDLGGRFSAFGRLGSLLMTPARVPIHTIGTPFRAKVARLEVDHNRYPHLDDLSAQRSPEHLARCIGIGSREIREAMDRLVREARNPGFSSDLLLEGVCSTIVVELMRYLEVQCEDGKRTAGLFKAELGRLTDYVDAHLDERIAVAHLASLIGLSERHFARRFREATGQSVHAFVEQARLRRARALLAEPDLSIKQVAFALGFASPANFSDAFLRQSGERPAAFRRRVASGAH